MEWLTVVVLVFAVHRLTRLVVADTLPLVAGPVARAKRAVAKRWGPGWAEGLDCPWCVSVWVSGVLVGAAALTVGVPLPWLLWPAVSTGASLVSCVEDWLDISHRTPQPRHATPTRRDDPYDSGRPS